LLNEEQEQMLNLARKIYHWFIQTCKTFEIEEWNDDGELTKKSVTNGQSKFKLIDIMQ